MFNIKFDEQEMFYAGLQYFLIPQCANRYDSHSILAGVSHFTTGDHSDRVPEEVLDFLFRYIF